MKAPKERKPRATPAFDRAFLVVVEIQTKAIEQAWSPKKVRAWLHASRNASRPVWRRAIEKVFGCNSLELPDTRQLDIFGGW